MRVVTDLAAFLLARIAEDEVVALSARDLDVGGVPRSHPWAVFGPDRVVADCNAKRRILADHRAYTRDVGWSDSETVCDRCRYDDGLDAETYPCLTLRALALPYADHPDYRSEWAS